MNQSPETTKTNKTFKHRLAVGALTLTAAIAPGVAHAETNGGVPTPSKHVATKKLEKQEDHRLWNQLPATFARGTLAIRTERHNGGTAGPKSVNGGLGSPKGATGYTNIENPLVVFVGDPQDMTSHSSLTNGHFMFGSLQQKDGHPRVTLHKFNPDTMQLVPSDGEEVSVQSVVFQSDKVGNLQLEQPMTDFDDGGPLLGPDDRPLPIGLEYTPKK